MKFKYSPFWLPPSLCALCPLWLIFFSACLVAETFTPESAAAYAIQHNRELIAARFAIHAAEGRLIQAGLWRNPEFEVGTDFDLNTRRGDRLVNLSFNQSFPLAGRLEKNRAIARVDVAMSIEELHNQERLLAGNVLGQTRNILLLDRRIAVHTQQLSLLERILEQTTALAASGQSDTVSIGVVQLEKTNLRLQRQSQIVARQTALATLGGLLGFSPEIKIALTGTLPGLPKTFDLAPNRADLRLATLAADKSLAEQLLARVEKWDDLTIGIGYTREKDSGTYDNMAQLKFSLPLPLWDRNQGRIAETAATHARTLADIEARSLAIQTEIDEARNRALGYGDILAQLRGSATAQAKQNTALIEQAIASGTGSFLAIYESRRQSLTLALTTLDTESQFVTALTDWQTRTGRLPGINLPKAANVSAK